VALVGKGITFIPRFIPQTCVEYETMKMEWRRATVLGVFSALAIETFTDVRVIWL